MLQRTLVAVKAPSVLKRLHTVRYKRLYTVADTMPVYTIAKRPLYTLQDFAYKDENWPPIKYIKHIFNAKALHLPYTPGRGTVNNSKVRIGKNIARIKTDGVKNDWVFLLSKKYLPNDYVIRFNATLHSEVTELQVAFNYTDITSRLRFLLYENKELRFDAVGDGYFINDLASTPYSFTPGKSYTVELAAVDGCYSISIDGKRCLTIKNRHVAAGRTKAALVLWNREAGQPMDAEIKDFAVYEVVK